MDSADNAISVLNFGEKKSRQTIWQRYARPTVIYHTELRGVLFYTFSIGLV